MTKNPSPMGMSDTGPNNDGHNDGFRTSSAMRGQTIVQAYGKDGSGMAGSASAERDTPRGMGGGVDNISHSLHGATPNMTGKSG